MSAPLTLEAVQKSVGTQFHVVRPGTHPVTLDLVDVTVGQSSPTQEQFSAIFSDSVAAGLGQGCFRLEQDNLGAFDLCSCTCRPGKAIKFDMKPFSTLSQWERKVSPGETAFTGDLPD